MASKRGMTGMDEDCKITPLARDDCIFFYVDVIVYSVLHQFHTMPAYTHRLPFAVILLSISLAYLTLYHPDVFSYYHHLARMATRPSMQHLNGI